MILRVAIPFQAIPAARPRADFIRGKGGKAVLKNGRPILRVYVPTRSMEWVYVVRRAMLEEAQRARLAAPWSEAVELTIYAFNACPKSDPKADKAVLRWNTKRGSDPDNIAKSIMDAGNQVWWADDAQIASLTVKTLVAREGEPSSVVVEAREVPIVVGRRPMPTYVALDAEDPTDGVVLDNVNERRERGKVERVSDDGRERAE